MIGGFDMKAWEIIQEARQGSSFDKVKVIEHLNSLPQKDFNEFCQGYLQLHLFYDSNVGNYATDMTDFIEANKEMFWQMKPVDPASDKGST